MGARAHLARRHPRAVGADRRRPVRRAEDAALGDAVTPVRTTTEVFAASGLTQAEVERLRLVLEDWQLLADLGFCDLVMWVCLGEGWVAVAHARPMTGPMAFVGDMIGRHAFGDLREVIDAAADAGQCIDADGLEGTTKVAAVPVRLGGRTVGVVTRHQPGGRDRSTSPLERTYGELTDTLSEMLVRGVALGVGPDGPAPRRAAGRRRGHPARRAGRGPLRQPERRERDASPRPRRPDPRCGARAGDRRAAASRRTAGRGPGHRRHGARRVAPR
ncbi:histidine kinase N-terminal domain-containing protein [Janibacter melonis]|uniref:histidine kinase N-terminal domain-containing protein n=1 Tax=Janibacter melonis TaxID=262209 RepID=UPI0035566612